jgi:glycosyltransferase involved in cell wall biosynthesis
LTELRPSLSVVIPAYNEEKRLPETLKNVLQYLAGREYSSEVVIVDDGSTDATAAIVAGWQAPPVPVRLIHHPDRRNHGKGAAVRRGVLAARGACRLFMDADNSTTCDQVAGFLPHIAEGYDVVIGSRDIAGAVIPIRQPWYKMLAGDAGNLVIRALAVPGIHDTQAGFKLFTDRAVEEIFPRLTLDRWGFDVEILAIARRRGLRVKEVPITWRNDPESKVRFSSYLTVLREVWSVRQNVRSHLYD